MGAPWAPPRPPLPTPGPGAATARPAPPWARVAQTLVYILDPVCERVLLDRLNIHGIVVAG